MNHCLRCAAEPCVKESGTTRPVAWRCSVSSPIADAVVNASYGDAHMTALSWGKANATGTAIRFKPAAAAAQPAPAAQ